MTITAAILFAAALGFQPVAPAQPAKPEAPKLEPAKGEPSKSADWPFTADKVERVADGLKFTEGPTWVKGQGGKPGFFVFCAKSENVVYRWDGGAEKPVAIRKDSKGAVGSTADASGNIYQVDSTLRRISKWSVKDGQATEAADYASKLDDKKLGGMNDCAVHSNGSVYATSAKWFLPRGEKVDFEGVIRVAPDGKVTKVAEGLKSPNGICFSPDGKTVYVTEYGEAKIAAYPLKDDGAFGEKKVVADLKAMSPEHNIDPNSGGADGIRCDSKGDIFSSGPGGVWVLTSEGKFIAHLPTGISNLAFGGEDGKTLLITTFDGVSKIGTKNAGAGW